MYKINKNCIQYQNYYLMHKSPNNPNPSNNNSRALRTSTISSTSSTTSKQLKLRTIMKGRGSAHGLIDQFSHPSLKTINDNNNHSSRMRIREEEHGRMSASMNLGIKSQSMMSHSGRALAGNQSQSVSRNTLRNQETINCEQQLLGKQDIEFQYRQISHKLDDIDLEADQLIRRKLRKITKKSQLITLKDKGRDEISQEIQQLVAKIKRVQLEGLEDLGCGQEKVRELLDRKIRIVEKLIAGSSTESQVLKKYFFAISAMNSQGKKHKKNGPKADFKTKDQKFFLVPIQSKIQRSKTQTKQSISNTSSNHHAFNAPKLHEYETYRYKGKAYNPNLQPLPRSSYKSEYLVYNPKGVTPLYKNMDNHTAFGKSRNQASTYSKDYRVMRAELVDYRELDSYRNKFKNLQVKFGSQNRSQTINQQFQNSISYITDQRRQQKTAKQSALLASKYQGQSPQSKKIVSNVSTEAKREFRGERQQIGANIKNRRLNSFKYAYKSLVNQ